MSEQRTLVSTKKHVAPSSDLSSPRPDHDGHQEEHHLERADVARIVFVAIACAAVWFRVWEPFQKFSVSGLAAALIGMFPILEGAFEAVLERRMTMELSMTIAIGAALAIDQFFTGLVIIVSRDELPGPTKEKRRGPS